MNGFDTREFLLKNDTPGALRYTPLYTKHL